ncbi:MAG: MOSC domain-containing protein [Bacteroidetes bacterium]|nr:MOSC domain-containing protein [Bacteroidota bacterium]
MGSCMKVLSINVSLPKEVDWHGRKITTSIFKTPVTGRRRVGRLNIEGDGQADLQAHGGEHRAVFVYQKESYEYWRKELGMAGLCYGQFGENLTVEGLADHEVCIGDRFRIGTAVFEVTQPRVTCYKVAFSTGVEEMPALLVKHKRPGFYFRVLVEGEIGVGDEIVRISSGKGGMTIVEVDGLLYSNAHPVDRLREVLGIEALSAGWRGSFQALYDAAVSGMVSGNAGLAPGGMVAAWQGWAVFTVVKIVSESIDVLAFELAPADGRRLPGFVAGQHIAVKIPGTDGSSVIRMYSLCGPGGSGFYRIGVKAEANGVGSEYMHRLRVGDSLEISAPRGVFRLVESRRPLVLMGAGIGITPLLAMLYSVDVERPVWWIYTTQDKEHYPFREEVLRVAGSRNYTFFTRTGDGRLTREKLVSLGLPVDGDYYLCGPLGFMGEMSAALKEMGISDEAIRQELFGGTLGSGKAPHVPDGVVGEGPMVTFAKSGIGFRWHPRFGSLLEAAEACDVPVSWACRVGVCHRCETTVFSGEVRYFSEPLDQPAEGNVLICCSVPKTDVQLDL